MKTRALAIAVLLTLPFVAAACGGSDDTNSGSRPTEKELADGIDSFIPDGLPDEAKSTLRDCLARELESSKLPNGILRSIAKGEEEQQIDADNEDKYTKIMTDVTTTCQGEATDAMAESLASTTLAGG